MGNYFSQGTISIVKPKKAKALIIGVSNYQNIKGLSYAHHDAAEFADYLKKNIGWQLGEDDVQLLTNENAKQGDILLGLQWLLDAAIDGEDVIFYFSGHGDVETVGEDKKGFLLANDSPKNNYPIGGTIEVSLLDSVFTALVNRDIKVWAIVDACRSGSLAGGMSGKQQTNEALAKQWANQIRILSAQPDQQSLEAKTWGGGRGVFSYYLVKGMAGYANSNADSKITLSELENYLGSNISVQTNYTQEPHVDGANKFSLAVALTDSSQMLRYANDVISGEVTFAMNTKSGEWNVEPSCMPYAEQLTALLEKGLQMDSFHNVTKQWNQLTSCAKEETPLTIRYHYMRSLINEINRVVNLSLTGEKMSLQPEMTYGIQLIEELQEMNKGKRFLAEAHFKHVKDYLKAMLLTMFQKDFLSNLKLPYLFVYHPNDKENFAWNEKFEYFDVFHDNFQENGVYGRILSSSNSDSSNLTITIEGSLDNIVGVVGHSNLVDSYLADGTFEVYAIIYGDSLLVYQKSSEKEKEKERLKVSYSNFEQKYIQLLSQQLNNDIQSEPDAAYLYFAKALLCNRLKEKDSAIFMLDKCMTYSPKYLNAILAKGGILRELKKNKQALVEFEKVLELDSIYRDFECVDCFFKDLISMYQQQGNPEKLDPAIDKWREMRGFSSSKFDDYEFLIYDHYTKKNQKKLWLGRLKKLQIDSLDHQLRLVYDTRFVYRNKYSNSVAIDFSRTLLKELVKGNYSSKQFFEDKTAQRGRNKIMRDFFPTGSSYIYEDSAEVLSHLNSILDARRSLISFSNSKLNNELRVIGAVSRFESLEWYKEWAQEVLDYKYKNQWNWFNVHDVTVDNRNEIQGVQNYVDSLRILIASGKLSAIDSFEVVLDIDRALMDISFLKEDDASAIFAKVFDLNVNTFQELYEPFFQDGFLYQFLLNCSEGKDDAFIESPDYERLKSMCSNYSDFETLKEIEKIMEQVYRYLI